MARGKAEDAGGLTPAKDGNAALCHFDPRTLPIFKCVDYIMGRQYFSAIHLIFLIVVCTAVWYSLYARTMCSGVRTTPERPARFILSMKMWEPAGVRRSRRTARRWAF